MSNKYIRANNCTVQNTVLMNGFNKTDAAVFSCRLCFLRAFPFIGLIDSTQTLPLETLQPSLPVSHKKAAETKLWRDQTQERPNLLVISVTIIR